MLFVQRIGIIYTRLLYFYGMQWPKTILLCLLLTYITQNTCAQGVVVTIDSFASAYVPARRVDVWLPPNYTPTQKYNVLYMHDGQNLFDPKTAYGQQAWEVDSVATQLMQQGKIPPCIIVGIWNTEKRFSEYMPAIPYSYLPDSFKTLLVAEGRTNPTSNQYLRFIVDELKPFIDSAYSTHPQRQHTYIAGSSMGGLISLYALLQYPTVFGGAACLSTHWPVSLKTFDPKNAQAFVRYIKEALPPKPNFNLYFDYGTATLDAHYQPYQQQIDSLLIAKGYSEENWKTLKFDGAAHNEVWWRKRVATPLLFLMGK